MIHQVTKGIKISVEVKFEGTFTRKSFQQHAFTYYVSIENLGKDTIQLVSRHWKILESTNRPHYLKGNGVVGVKPILKSGEIYSYKSGCLINSTVGSMSGKYTMINFTNAQKFSVEVPNFKLSVPYILN